MHGKNHIKFVCMYVCIYTSEFADALAKEAQRVDETVAYILEVLVLSTVRHESVAFVIVNLVTAVAKHCVQFFFVQNIKPNFS